MLFCLTRIFKQQFYYFVRREQAAIQINPLENPHYTIINGKLIIHDPQDTKDNGDYHCVAKNRFGSVLSNSVQLAFGCKYLISNLKVCLKLCTRFDKDKSEFLSFPSLADGLQAILRYTCTVS